MDIPASFFASYSSLLTAKSVNLIIGTQRLPFLKTKIIGNFSVSTLTAEVLFKELLIRAAA